ncbi:MAG: hypothetical protein LC672_06375 [Acidobacteria bacterium]|nr:hypothetical protein [Acidobacteriota bacterium]
MQVDPCLKLASALFLIALVCGPAADAARAQGPPEGYTYSNEYDAGVACPFPVRVEVSGREKVIFLPGGRITVASPGLNATFTNLSTGRQERLSVAGSIHVTFEENGDSEIVFTGRNFLEGFNPELPALALTVGRLSIALDPAGNFIRPAQGSAKVINVCSLVE